MNDFRNTFKRFFYKIQDFFPTRLPNGLTHFNDWCDRLLFTYFPPEVSPPSEDSFRFSIAAMVMHLDAGSAKKSNRFFGKAIQKGAANEVASYVMQTLKAKREALILKQNEDFIAKVSAERAAKSAEAPATKAEANNGHPIQEF